MLRRNGGGAAALALLAPSLTCAKFGQGNFSLQPTQDLYELCSAPSDHPDHAPAIYSCRAFLVATVPYYDAVSDGKTVKRLISWRP